MQRKPGKARRSHDKDTRVICVYNLSNNNYFVSLHPCLNIANSEYFLEIKCQLSVVLPEEVHHRARCPFDAIIIIDEERKGRLVASPQKR